MSTMVTEFTLVYALKLHSFILEDAVVVDRPISFKLKKKCLLQDAERAMVFPQ